MAAQIFRHQHRVTYAEVTVGNHIYYGRYLNLLEEVRGEFFRSLGRPMLEWQQADLIFPVIECQLRYKAPARYDDLLTLEVWITTAHKVRLNFAYRITNQHGTLILEGETYHVSTSVGEKMKRLPDELLNALSPYLHPAEVKD